MKNPGQWCDKEWRVVADNGVGKRAAGRLLDGREHNQKPEVKR